jgi:hypothetical protein
MVESTFAFIILDKNYKEIAEFSSSNEYWISSYRAETFGLLSSLITLPEDLTLNYLRIRKV